MSSPSNMSGSSAGRPFASDPGTLTRHFGQGEGLLPLWVAEPSVDVAPAIVAAMEARAGTRSYGYEIRPGHLIEAFWAWTAERHRWDGSGVLTSVSPSVGTSIGVLIDLLTQPGDGVILQPPVFTDFKPLVVAAGREVVRSPLVLTAGRYTMGLDDLAAKASEPATRMLILCNPHNPVGRVWTSGELAELARACADNGVFVVADEIHGDLALPPARFVPFASVAAGTGVSWASIHGPIKTFGLAGVCDTLLVTDDEQLTKRFQSRSSQLHLTRNNVFGLAAFEAAYSECGGWLDDLLALVAANVEVLQDRLPSQIGLIVPEGTYLVWLDLRGLGLGVPELVDWTAGSARLALSPGHWFGREGAGFARMTIAAPTSVIEEAAARLQQAVAMLDGAEVGVDAHPLGKPRDLTAKPD